MRTRSLAAIGLIVAAGATFAGCTDRVGASPAAYGPTATPTPGIGASATVTTSTTSTTVVPTIAAGGVSSNATLPITSVVASVTETTSIAAPAGVTPLSAARAAAAVRKTADVTDTPVDYLEFTSTSTVTLDGVPAISFTLPAITPGATYYLAMYNDAEGTYTLPGEVATVSGTTVTFAAMAGSETITPTAPLTYALYAATGTTATATPSPTPTASPTPSPSPSPTATPTPAPIASPNTLVFDATSPSPQAIAVSEPGATGSFTASITCSAAPDTFVAELQNTTTTAPSGSFSVLNGSDVGTCTVTITDASGAQTTVAIQNNAYALGISGVHRK